MKRRWLAMLMLFLPLAPAASRARAEDDKKATQGTWVPLSAELAGKRFPDATLKAWKLVVSDGEYTVTIGEQIDQGTVKLDPSGKPKAMDITGVKGPNAGKTIPAIYELTGDTLKVCYNLGDGGRPAEFSTKADTKLFLVTYQRQKP